MVRELSVLSRLAAVGGRFTDFNEQLLHLGAVGFEDTIRLFYFKDVIVAILRALVCRNSEHNILRLSNTILIGRIDVHVTNCYASFVSRVISIPQVDNLIPSFCL